MNNKLGILLLLFLTSFFLFLQFSSISKNLDLKSLDLFRGSHVAHQDIVILAIDNKSLQKIGRWPWKRSIHADILTKLNTYNPQLVGYDVTFSEPTNEEEDGKFANSLENTTYPVVLTSQAV